MPKRGDLKPGSLAARIAAIVAEGFGEAVSRQAISARLAGSERCWLGRTLSSLQLAGLIVEAADGFRLAEGRAPEAPLVEREAPPLAEHSRQILAALIRRAHRLRASGMIVGAAELLRDAAERLGRHPAANDLQALADLFEHAPTLYPTLDLRARAAA
ncbi:MAG: hypothetical protein DI537_08635 [Stutzerimonas stutzeri]|nr:MAG: hypothetical protein DI537_08635 [Stutzerimonas stutzeri]